MQDQFCSQTFATIIISSQAYHKMLQHNPIVIFSMLILLTSMYLANVEKKISQRFQLNIRTTASKLSIDNREDTTLAATAVLLH